MFKRYLASLGPGLIVAATAIGSSHIILSPLAGARFGYALLWLVLVSHAFKYPAFEFGPRFAVATDSSLIEGYRRVPGPRNWAVWVFLATTTLQGLTIVTGVLSVTSSILVAGLGFGSLSGWIAALGVGIVLLHRTGGYRALAHGSKMALFILVVVSLIAFAASPPQPREWFAGFAPTLPLGSTVLVASILGLMPTGINVAIWHSLWAVEHLPHWKQNTAGRRQLLRVAMTDLNTGYWLSAGLALVFMSLGAELLKPRGLTPSGIEVAVTLSRIYTDVLGAWMYPVFMTAAFAAMFSTSYSVMDGFPRAFSRLLKILFANAESVHRPSDPAYWSFMAFIFVFAMAVNTFFPNPVLLVVAVGIVSLAVAPVLYALNYYCVTRVIEDEEMRPSMGMRLWALAGIVVMFGAVVFSLVTRFGSS